MTWNNMTFYRTSFVWFATGPSQSVEHGKFVLFGRMTVVRMTRNTNKPSATLKFLCWNSCSTIRSESALVYQNAKACFESDCEAWAESIMGKGSYGRVHLSGVENAKESTQGFPSDSTGGPPTCETGPSIHMPHTATIMSVKEKHQYVLKQSFITQQSFLHPPISQKRQKRWGTQ